MTDPGMIDLTKVPTVTDPKVLRERFGEPLDKGLMMHIPYLHDQHKLFIAHAPYVSVATAAQDGIPTVSPKGNAPGFVHVLDDQTLIIPDRPGNNQAVNLINLVRNPGVGLCFLIPGIREVLRIVGGLLRARQALHKWRPFLAPPQACIIEQSKRPALITRRNCFVAGIWPSRANRATSLSARM